MAQNGQKLKCNPLTEKKCKTNENLVVKHFFLTFWLALRCFQVSGWVVGWGTPWGGGKGVKLGKNQVMIKMVEKNDENRKK